MSGWQELKAERKPAIARPFINKALPPMFPRVMLAAAYGAARNA
jgi:hypothetical protein